MDNTPRDSHRQADWADDIVDDADARSSLFHSWVHDVSPHHVFQLTTLATQCALIYDEGQLANRESLNSASTKYTGFANKRQHMSRAMMPPPPAANIDYA